MSVAINPDVPPGGTGCLQCLAGDGWWFNLRRCAACGNIGCCDSSPNRHARLHAAEAGHPVLRSFEPGEDWFWDLDADGPVEDAPELAPPLSRPLDQDRPGPAGRVPPDWQERLH